jgi:hypothetical protein
MKYYEIEYITAHVTLLNGLGDKLLDLMGFYVICKYLNYKPYITLDKNQTFAWGSTNYDPLLFNFRDVTISDDASTYIVTFPITSWSSCPYKVYAFLKSHVPGITFKQVSESYEFYASQIINPAEAIYTRMPNNLQNAYGIHLRKSDKVNNNAVDSKHENTVDEFNMITDRLLADIMSLEDDAYFLIVSEDLQWKQEFIRKMSTKKAIFLQPAYTGDKAYDSVLDFFCLSRCKEILQGVKYSTFSMMASMLGTKRLRNYWPDRNARAYIWGSVLTINNYKNVDENYHKALTDDIPGPQINT